MEERNYDEVIADMLIQLDQIERRRIEQDKRMEKVDKRLDLTIARMVKAENRMELFDKKLEQSLRRMEMMDKKLEQSIKDQREFSHVQSKMNKYFLQFIKKNSIK